MNMSEILTEPSHIKSAQGVYWTRFQKMHVRGETVAGMSITYLYSQIQLLNESKHTFKASSWLIELIEIKHEEHITRTVSDLGMKFSSLHRTKKRDENKWETKH